MGLEFTITYCENEKNHSNLSKPIMKLTHSYVLQDKNHGQILFPYQKDI